MFGYGAKIVNNKLLLLGGHHPVVEKNFLIHILCLDSYRWDQITIKNKNCTLLTNFAVFKSNI